MPIDKKEDDKKKPEGEGAPPTAEAILVERTLDPDQAVFAEQAIRRFAAERLGEWHEQMDSALDLVETWLQSQGDDAKAAFSQRGFFDMLGDRIIVQMRHLAGGGRTPIMDALAEETDQTVSWAEHAESDIGGFLDQARRGVRDACWFVRDALPSIVSTEWPQLLNLAYEGSTDFVAMLHSLGLPPFAFQPSEFADHLIGYADAYRKSMAPLKEAAAKNMPDDSKKSEVEESAKQAALDDGVKKPAQASTI